MSLIEVCAVLLNKTYIFAKQTGQPYKYVYGRTFVPFRTINYAYLDERQKPLEYFCPFSYSIVVGLRITNP